MGGAENLYNRKNKFYKVTWPASDPLAVLLGEGYVTVLHAKAMNGMPEFQRLREALVGTVKTERLRAPNTVWQNSLDILNAIMVVATAQDLAYNKDDARTKPEIIIATGRKCQPIEAQKLDAGMIAGALKALESAAHENGLNPEGYPAGDLRQDVAAIIERLKSCGTLSNASKVIGAVQVSPDCYSVDGTFFGR